MNYTEMTKKILPCVGGIENITHIGHCATRLRIDIKDISKVDEATLRKIQGALGVVFKNNQVQIIIGANVGEAYDKMIEVSNFHKASKRENTSNKEKSDKEKSECKKEKGFQYYVNVIGGFFAELFMPIVPILAVGGVIASLNKFFVNYFGLSPENGTSVIISAIFSAAYTMLPVYLGFTTARKLKLQPVMGAFLGALLVNPAISGVEGLNFLGLPITTANYSGSVMPVILGVAFMYYVSKVVKRIIPDVAAFLLRPLLTMLIVVPVTLIVLGPLGTIFSEYVGILVLWLMNNAGFITLPIVAICYPYMLMLGLDKALMPIGFQLVETLGYTPLNVVMGFISNMAITGTIIALAIQVRKNNKEVGGAYFSHGFTALCGITEPAFYGALIKSPKVLIGTACGAGIAGIFASAFELKSFVMGGSPGILTLPYFLEPDGGVGNLIIALSTAAIAILISFVIVTVILRKIYKTNSDLLVDKVKSDLDGDS